MSNGVTHPEGFILQARIKAKYGGSQVNFVPFSGGLTEQQVSQVIHGRRLLKATEAEAWSTALDLSVEYLLMHFGERRMA